jgi:prevent-host-death family protein
MTSVNIHEAKTQFSRLVDAAAAGEEILICKAGKPVARLSALKEPAPPRKRGLLKGAFHVPDDFDAPLPADVLAEFEGR